MRRAYFIIAAVIFWVITSPVFSKTFADMEKFTWENVGRSIIDSDLRMVQISPDDAKSVYICSSSTVYKTTDGGRQWDEVLSFRGTGNAVNSIAITPADARIIYAGTDEGLYRSNNAGMKWEKIFSGIGESERSVLFAAIHPEDPDVIYIGTRGGLFLTRDKGKDWERARNIPSDASVYFIAINIINPDVIYTAADDGLYKSTDSGAGWVKILESKVMTDINITSDEPETIEAEEVTIEKEIQSIAIDPVKTNTIYVGTSHGLLVSRDAGSKWESLSSSGLGSPAIRSIVIDTYGTGNLYAATSRGVFRYSMTAGSWEEVYKGIVSSDVRYLALASTAQNALPVLWAAAKNSVYRSTVFLNGQMRVPDHQNEVTQRGELKVEDALSHFSHEPSIEEIREAAITYAEVQPGKIEKWRKAAALKALLPDVSFAYGRDEDWQKSSYRYNYQGEEMYKDDDITKGRDNDWSISLKWQLGELIWNNDQTSIDTRSRLMVQLRDDVLNEVTRLYFERRRLQVELMMSPSIEIPDKIEKELRLQELTANIDSLTGSLLSKRAGQGGSRAQHSWGSN